MRGTDRGEGPAGILLPGLEAGFHRWQHPGCPDTAENLVHFGRQESSRGQAAFPQLRFVALCENGPHAIFAVRMGACGTHELTLAAELVGELRAGMLCLADRLYPSFSLWKKAADTGAALLWRTRSNADLPVEEVLEDGSHLSRIHPSGKARRKKRGGLAVRVIEYELEGVEGAEPGASQQPARWLPHRHLEGDRQCQ